MLIRIIALISSLYYSNGSVVIDSMSQKGYQAAEYCPKSQFCEEGAHVMCMYYNPNQLMGPRCSNPQNVSMTSEIADKLLEVSNAVRSRIALGRETGKDGPLPRGYGIFRLSWDEELATFGQVLANQCVLTRDLCRATKKFPDPGQATGLVRFTFPDWLPVSNRSYFTTSNLTPPKLNYAITQTMKTWYNQKNYVTQDMISSYPDFQNMKSQFGKLYLKMIHGAATHMGCGISAYTQFAYYDNNSPLNYNVVCNYSTRPGTGLQVYTIDPPTKIGYTIKCGCPEGYDEDSDCLCFESRKQNVAPPLSPNFCADDSCRQSVVLLPIFTVEDAPPQELLHSRNTSRRRETSGLYHQQRIAKKNAQSLEPQNLNEFIRILQNSNDARITHDLVQSRFENQELSNKLHHTKANLSIGTRRVLPKHESKNSIFSRAEKFQLPMKNTFVSYRITGKGVKKDVAPRKDFSNVQKLLKSYLNKKRNHVGNIFNGKNHEYTSNEPLKPNAIDEHVSANNFVERIEVVNPSRVQNTYSERYGNENFNTTRGVKESHTNGDRKLIALLDNLENEVEHVELDSTDKEIFDFRIRKIYDRIASKQIKPTKIATNKKNNHNFINYKIAANDGLADKNALKSKVSLDYKLTFNDDTGLLKRDQNSIRNINNYKNFYKDNKRDDNKNIRKMDIEGDQLSYERRKYYQDKLDSLQRKLESVRNTGRSNINSPRQVMPVRPTKVGNIQVRPSKTKQIDTFYIPDRARFIQGF